MKIVKHSREMTIIIVLLISMCFSRCTDYPVNNIATADALVKYSEAINDQPFLIFPEGRENPLKWFDSIPEIKIRESVNPGVFELKAFPGEFFVFQLGFWAVNENAENVDIEFSGFEGKEQISPEKITCFNKEGTDFMGRHFTKNISVPQGRVQPLWIGIDLDNIPSGSYEGSVSVISNGIKKTVPLKLKINGDPVENHGYNEGSRMARLNWLNSTAGINNEITKGFEPVRIDGNKISIVGRTITISENGLPEAIESYFSPSNQSLEKESQPILGNAFRFIIEKENGEIIKLNPGGVKFGGLKPSGVSWTANNSSDEANLEVSGYLEYDGFIDYRMKLVSKANLKVKDIRLEIPVEMEKATYMMGLGHEGGYRKENWKWKWDVSKNHDMLWIGAVNGGIRVKWKAENYIRPLLNVYYEFGPLKMPPSWENKGRGGVDVSQKKDVVIINAYSGKREVAEGEELNYNFELLLTPFRVVDRAVRFGDRYYHGGGTNTSVKVENAKKTGANVINIHHAEDIYPFINYPYLDANVEELKNLTAEAHAENMRLKLYYTTRELTKNIPEFWAIYSLNGEVLYPGPGNESKTVINPDGPNEWLKKNLREKYIPAWYNTIKEGRFKDEIDLSVITTPDSRLNNFYVAGLEWMVKNLEIDGVYIDDSALDRYTLQRARKVIDQYRPEGRMDLHSWNHFNKWAGFANCLNLYMDLLPYFDLVWIGEGRNYDREPDHWLVEVSGIPFGLTGQMLEGGGNPWRGMVYGITNREGYLGNSPSGMWKFWDEHNFLNKVMIGYWETNVPVKSQNSNVKATVYRGDEETIISVANWSDKDQPDMISVNWNQLGISSDQAEITVPFIADFQDELKNFNLNRFVIPAKKGYIIVLKKKIDK